MPRPTWGLILALVLLAGCGAPLPPVRTPATPQEVAAARAAQDFVDVVGRVAPVAREVCRVSDAARRCDFQILVDDRPDQPANAFETEDRFGRPTIVFTLPLIAEVRNRDELAFILGHEAAHHIAGHFDRATAEARFGALVLGNLAAATGQPAEAVEVAAAIGAEVGFRRFSKEYELEADALGARIAQLAGFDPIRGALFFARIPDPGDEFLGTHPPNAQRLEVIRASVAGANG